MTVDRRLSITEATRAGLTAAVRDPRILAAVTPLLVWKALTFASIGGTLEVRSFVPSRDVPEALILEPLVAATVALLVAWRSGPAVSFEQITARIIERWTVLLAAAALILVLKVMPRAFPDSALFPLGTVAWIASAYVQIRIMFTIQGIVLEAVSLEKSLSYSWRTTERNVVRLIVLRGLTAMPMLIWLVIDGTHHHGLRDAAMVLLTTLWLPFAHAIETSAFLQLAGVVREPFAPADAIQDG